MYGNLSYYTIVILISCHVIVAYSNEKNIVHNMKMNDQAEVPQMAMDELKQELLVLVLVSQSALYYLRLVLELSPFCYLRWAPG